MPRWGKSSLHCSRSDGRQDTIVSATVGRYFPKQACPKRTCVSLKESSCTAVLSRRWLHPKIGQQSPKGRISVDQSSISHWYYGLFQDFLRYPCSSLSSQTLCSQLISQFLRYGINRSGNTIYLIRYHADKGTYQLIFLLTSISKMRLDIKLVYRICDFNTRKIELKLNTKFLRGHARFMFTQLLKFNV